MPTYEYQCQDCGGQFEYFQSMSEPRKEKCETCGGTLTRLVSGGTGLIFKGSGFYITDYKSTPGGEKKGSEGGEKSGGKSESKSESKSEGTGGAKSDAGSKPSDSAGPKPEKSSS